MKLGKTLVVGTVAGLALAVIGRFHLQAQPPQEAAPPQAKGQGGPGGMPDMIGPLKATPGCLGVEAARTMTGKNVIFAWFEDKQALMNWYDSDLHQQMMTRFFGGEPDHEPLEHLKDDDGPILCIASIMPAKPGEKGAAGPFAQIGIELYKPLPGGAAIGGRFAPDAMEVEGLRDYSEGEPEAADESREVEKKP